MIIKEVLKPLLKDRKITWHSQLLSVLEQKSKYSPTTKLCVDVLIKPLFLCLLFIIAEREGHWPPHLEADKNKIPIFSAADHVNYARWGLYYISSMEALPDNIHSHFIKGEHTI